MRLREESGGARVSDGAVTRRLSRGLVLFLGVALAFAGLAGLATAPPGDVLLTVNEPEPMISCCGIGIEWDGARILYTHYQDTRILFTDLTGANRGALTLRGPTGRYNGDCCNAIALSWSNGYLYGGGWNSSDLSRVDMTTGTTTLVKANALGGGGFIDGLAWDPTTNTLWMSNDVSCNVRHLDIFGNDMGGFDGCALTGFANSGLAIDRDETMFYGTANNGRLFTLDLRTDPPMNLGVFSHTGGRDEDMSCGPLYTKPAGNTVTTLLVQDTYADRFTLIEMAPGKCLPPGGGSIDLRVSAGDLGFLPSDPFPFGATVSIRATAHNVGTQEARDVSVRFSDGPPGSTPIGVDQVLPLIDPSGGTGDATVTWTAGPQGAHDVCVVVDPDKASPETDETNNQACRPRHGPLDRTAELHGGNDLRHVGHAPHPHGPRSRGRRDPGDEILDRRGSVERLRGPLRPHERGGALRRVVQRGQPRERGVPPMGLPPRGQHAAHDLPGDRRSEIPRRRDVRHFRDAVEPLDGGRGCDPSRGGHHGVSGRRRAVGSLFRPLRPQGRRSSRGRDAILGPARERGGRRHDRYHRR
ncbi:MAG: hypothetical protein E6K18_05530 [Methanobacteriota archaeon]|nr:MAG: hypothetical protein E6K18_05530 [Euryarchaeota archaeon]